MTTQTKVGHTPLPPTHAANPDLLAALRLCVIALQRRNLEGETRVQTTAASEAIRHALYAIDRAEGRR